MATQPELNPRNPNHLPTTDAIIHVNGNHLTETLPQAMALPTEGVIFDNSTIDSNRMSSTEKGFPPPHPDRLFPTDSIMKRIYSAVYLGNQPTAHEIASIAFAEEITSKKLTIEEAEMIVQNNIGAQKPRLVKKFGIEIYNANKRKSRAAYKIKYDGRELPTTRIHVKKIERKERPVGFSPKQQEVIDFLEAHPDSDKKTITEGLYHDELKNDMPFDVLQNRVDQLIKHINKKKIKEKEIVSEREGSYTKYRLGDPEEKPEPRKKTPNKQNGQTKIPTPRKKADQPKANQSQTGRARRTEILNPQKSGDSNSKETPEDEIPVVLPLLDSERQRIEREAASLPPTESITISTIIRCYPIKQVDLLNQINRNRSRPMKMNELPSVIECARRFAGIKIDTITKGKNTFYYPKAF